MFSALKKLVGSDQAPPGRDRPIPAGLQSMNQALQRRFAKGVQYNMKIVIRGDRNTGKTTLWHRLQGKKFVEEYIPTQEIQVTSIHWNYKTTDDIVKVEVWDVVDKGQKINLRDSLGKCKKRGDGLKLENDPQEAEAEMALDAEFLDVYKNCNGVVMMFDITKQWTFSYILRELPKVPTHVPVCVLGNYRDMGEHRVILPDDVRDFIHNLNRPPGASYFRYAESSMKNSFGLKYLHKFFNIPFLQLQRETLLRQLETNQLDIDATLEELSVQQETEDQNYEIFLEMMEVRSRGHASPPAANGQSPSSGSQSPVVPPLPPPMGDASGSSSPGTPLPPPLPVAPQHNEGPPAEAPEPPPSAVVVAAAAPPPKRSIISRLFGSSPAPEAAPDPSLGPPLPPPSAGVPPKVQSVEDFVPEESLDRSFLEDPAPQRGPRPGPRAPHTDSDSDQEASRGNPLVAGFQDDLDLDDRLSGKAPHASTRIPSKNIALSSEEEEEEPRAAEEDVPHEEGAKRPSQKASRPPKPSPLTKAPDPTAAPSSLPTAVQRGLEPNGGPLVPASASPSSSLPPHKAWAPKQKAGDKGGESESDPEGPIATQMLSFVMDDPDFESEESDAQRKGVAEFPVREEDLSDVSDEEAPSRPPPPQPLKPIVHAFKAKGDADLFGLGLEEAGPKDSSEEEKDKSSSKEKKKKKKRSSKEEEDKASGKKKSRPKKDKEKEKEEGKEEKKSRRKRRSKDKGGSEIDELEAFLGGRGAGPTKQRGGGDYEEL
ncbi:rab-like protein 6 isoform X1 [Anolis carolinensis]|uniref:rab-like protein 6 isoform X1 n=1 Tax=Anolis carolinensis TaxID=28377 RepID=UPI002F2B880D